MPTVAEMVEDVMLRKGITQQRLAHETGITAPWINMILRRGKAPGPSALLRIAEVLGLDKRKLVRQAHHERAYMEWRPYLDAADSSGSESAASKPHLLPVIGTASAGDPSGEVKVEREGAAAGSDGTSEAPGDYSSSLPAVGFHPECKAIRVSGESLEPVAYDGQYVAIYPLVRKEEISDGSIVYVTYELPGDKRPRAMIKRVYRNRLAGEAAGDSALPVYVFVPVNTHLRCKGSSPEPFLEPYGALTLRHRQVREMYPVVGVIFENAEVD